MTKEQAETLDKLITQPYGAILVAGPVGAGKTSTLYNCLERINSPLKNVMTIEDPIEHRIPGINQTQINNQGEMGFSEGLRAMLRQDPDIIMIGEIRDDETARIGIRAALTGVLVFSTLHGSDAPSTISNLYNFGIPGYQLSSSLLAIVSQRLIRKICPYCRVTYTADEKMLEDAGARSRRASRSASPPRPGLPGVLPDRLPGADRDLRDHGHRRGAARPGLPADPQGRPAPHRGRPGNANFEAQRGR